MKKQFKESNYIRYSNCHEDPCVLLSQVKKTDETALSIASGGDNTFSLLVHNFKTIYAFDNNPVQLFLMKLKAYGIKHLTRDEFLILIGITKGDSLQYYQKISCYLDEETKNYFDNHKNFISKIKIVHCGRFEHYFQLFKKYGLKFTHSKRVLLNFMNFESCQKQWDYYQRKFNNRRFKLLFSWFFSKKIMSKYGRDSTFFNHAKGNPTDHLKNRLELGFQNVLNKDNPFMQYVIFNEFITLPHYLEKENYEKIKQRIDNIKYINGDIKTIYDSNVKIDFFNLSDIFEYMSEEETINNQEMIWSMSNNLAKIVFWNMMVKRTFSLEKFKKLEEEEVFKRDKAFYYNALRIYEKINN